MSVYWEGLIGSYGAPTKPAVSTASNPGISSSFTNQPITKPQHYVGTLFQEFPPLDPSYADGSDSIVFHTTFGDYSFSKTQPFMSFNYRDGVQLVSHSIFYVNSTFQSPMILSNYTIDRANLDNRHFRYTVSLRTAGNLVGTLQISFIFDKFNRPKISVHLNPTETLTAHGFNVIWIVRGPQSYARFREAPAGLSFSNYTTLTPVGMNETQLELGSDSHPENWRTSALVDWSDSSLGAKIGFGRLPLFGYLPGPAAVVTFPGNVSNIDPAIVGHSNAAYGSAQSFQRHTFFDGTNYWVFFYNGTSTVYEYSADGITWNHPLQVLWAYAYTTIWYSSGNFYALAGTSATGTSTATAYLYFKKGTVSSGSINWLSTVTVDTRTYTHSGSGILEVWSNLQDPNLVLGSDGNVTSVYTWYTMYEYQGYGPRYSVPAGRAGWPANS